MKESTLSIMAFILLVTVFSIVALTASLTDNSADNQVSSLSQNSNESKSDNGPIRNQSNYLSNNAEESEPQNAFMSAPVSRSGDDPNEPGAEAASTGHRVKYPRVDYNDGKGAEADKDDYVYTDDVVE
jgi:cytoskeletal protein RodZ